jgi:hypothetical protein
MHDLEQFVRLLYIDVSKIENQNETLEIAYRNPHTDGWHWLADVMHGPGPAILYSCIRANKINGEPR